MTDNKAKPLQEFANKKNVVWVIMSASIMFLVLALLIIGGGDQIISSVYSVMLWCGIFGGTLARYLDKNGWIGFGIGSGIGVILHIFAPVLTLVLLG